MMGTLRSVLPTQATDGPFSYTIQVTENVGATANNVNTGNVTAELSISSTPSSAIQVDVSYSQTNVASGGTSPYTYSVFSGSLPNGTTLDTSTGTVSGTPTTKGPVSYTIHVTHSLIATANGDSSGTILAAPLVITSTPSAIAHVGVSYSQTNVASGGTAPYAFSVISGSLPNGTTLDASTGTVAGIPITAGAFSYTIQLEDSLGLTATHTITGTMGLSTYQLISTPSANIQLGAIYSQITESGGSTVLSYNALQFNTQNLATGMLFSYDFSLQSGIKVMPFGKLEYMHTFGGNISQSMYYPNLGQSDIDYTLDMDVVPLNTGSISLGLNFESKWGLNFGIAWSNSFGSDLFQSNQLNGTATIRF